MNRDEASVYGGSVVEGRHAASRKHAQETQ